MQFQFHASGLAVSLVLRLNIVLQSTPQEMSDGVRLGGLSGYSIFPVFQLQLKIHVRR
jgi:hypothetical protein